MKRILTYLMIVPVLALTACEPRTDDDLAMTDTDTLATQQDNRFAQAELQSWLDEIDRNMEQLQARAQNVGEDADFDLDDLRERRDEIRRDLQEAGTDNDSWIAGLGRDVQTRLRDLDSDVEEARLKAIEPRDEFLAEVRTRLNEIDSDLEALDRRAGTTTGAGTTGQTGTMGDTDRDMTDGTDMGMTDRDATADGRTGADATTDQRTDAYGTGTGNTYADVDVEELREDRADIAEQLQEAEADADTEFDNARDNLASSVADLRARVQEANIELRSQDTSMGMQTSPNTASVN